MSLFYELCRLCLNNCSSLGIIVCPEDFRHQKIRDCLSIIITDDQFKICSDCDGKLSCFYQFRINSVRVQHEFADIMRSMQQPQYEPQYDSIYPSVYDENPAVQNDTQDYQPNMYHLDHELHLALDDNHSLISMPTNNNDSIYQQQVQTPSTPHIELQSDPVPNEPISPPPFDDFPYDDFDESRESFPSDRNNVDNAIDKKIEEFIQNKRSKTNPKICTICNKLFRTNYKLREHMQTHENNPKFICEFSECGKTFKSKIGLKEHSARHTGQFNFTCDICQKQFLLRSYFLAHQKIHSNAKAFACTMCNKTFKSKQNLVNHENFHYGLKLFPCFCGKSFTTKTNLDVHAKSHEQQVEQFECNVCGKFFKTRAYLKVHTKTHYKSLQNYACHCGKTFIQLCDLKIHSKTHTNQRDFVCEICGDAFTRKDSLKHHVTSAHTKDKFFTCTNCSRSFTRKTTLNKHLKKCLTDLNSSTV
ncbi:hypothetical protein PVAND_016565 [Polypedilum vanderplanki]|uniref:C2H2-type domain-containing protein n=1 Tax=Polypedilum vanderplanki TaxID=319348 RepID=A0A9J6BGN3_POLVA|nr:hypothetical protein PVAND_016565 [Polypedilum vanderplanki]